MAENRFVVMKSQILYLFFVSGFCSFTVGSSDFHLIDLIKTYNEAKSYCRDMYTDLATVHSLADMNNLITLVPTDNFRAWIGLEIGDVWMWHWSWPDHRVDFLNWKAGEPKKENQDTCVAMDPQGEWFESDCRTKRRFVCHGNGAKSDQIFVADTKSWRDAQNHCRDLSSDLVSIHSAEENEAVHNVSVSQNVWIGLFKDRWKWSDGSNSSFRNWKPKQPNYLEDQDCVAVVFNDGRWNDLKCSGKHRFVCRGAKKSIPTATNQTSTQDTFPTEVIVTFHFTVVASTKQPNTTNVTTEEETTATELTTPNTTDVVYSTSSTELNNATTAIANATATQLPPDQNTTQLSTQMSTENSQSLPPAKGNLILIQQNVTWIEAMSFCREHHIDLVHITTKDIQEKVAEKAKNATTPYVWLGLRYTCNSNFWFWTRSTTACYQNWAPGQGSEGKYDCGVTGAIEATGRQQWVGLPETEKLNFICYACAG